MAIEKYNFENQMNEWSKLRNVKVTLQSDLFHSWQDLFPSMVCFCGIILYPALDQDFEAFWELELLYGEE